MWLFSRYKGYTPLWADIHSLRNANRVHALRILGVLSVICISLWYNGYLIVKLSKRWPTPLDNYQHLNPNLLLNDQFYQSLKPPNHEETAVVTFMHTDSYAPAIATLGHSLDRVNSTATRLLFHLPEHISPEALCIATSSGFVPHPVTRIAPPLNGADNRFLDAYSKLNLWTLRDAGYQSVVYIDANTLVLRNFDELYSLPYRFGAVTDVDYGSFLEFNTGMIVARPDTVVFRDMMEKMQTLSYDGDQAEHGFLNQYYAAAAVRLPYAYNANLAIKKRHPEMWGDLWKRARVVHYTLVMPFLAEPDNSGNTVVPMDGLEANVRARAGEFDGVFKEELHEWLGVWKETYAKYGDKLRECKKGDEF